MPGAAVGDDQVQTIGTRKSGGNLKELREKDMGRLSRMSKTGDIEIPIKSSCKKIEDKILEIFDGKLMMIIMTLATFLALFGDDIRLASSAKSSDDAFYVVFLVCLVLFAVEFIAFCVAR